MLAPRDQLPEKIPEEKETPDLGVRKRTSIGEHPGKDKTPVLAVIEEGPVQENLKWGVLKNPERTGDTSRATPSKVTFKDFKEIDDENDMVKPFGFSNQLNGEPLAELSSQEPLAGRKNLSPNPVI
jgi:hypothetical protein